MLLLYARSEGYSFAKCTAMREFSVVLDTETYWEMDAIANTECFELLSRYI